MISSSVPGFRSLYLSRISPFSLLRNSPLTLKKTSSHQYWRVESCTNQLKHYTSMPSSNFDTCGVLLWEIVQLNRSHDFLQQFLGYQNKVSLFGFVSLFVHQHLEVLSDSSWKQKKPVCWDWRFQLASWHSSVTCSDKVKCCLIPKLQYTNNKMQYFRLRLYDPNFDALNALWVLSDIERWRLTALDKFDTNEQKDEH